MFESFPRSRRNSRSSRAPRRTVDRSPRRLGGPSSPVHPEACEDRLALVVFAANVRLIRHVAGAVAPGQVDPGGDQRAVAPDLGTVDGEGAARAIGKARID